MDVKSLYRVLIKYPYLIELIVRFFRYRIVQTKITNFMKIEYNNLYSHYILTTLDRRPLIKEVHRERIEKYITGIVNHNECKLYAIYANPEHVHLVVSRAPNISDEALVTIIADSSQKFITEHKLCDTYFEWMQKGAAFSLSKGDLDRVCKYVLNQPLHHKKTTYAEEYESFINFYQRALRKK